jgi:hypothetical protein
MATGRPLAGVDANECIGMNGVARRGSTIAPEGLLLELSAIARRGRNGRERAANCDKLRRLAQRPDEHKTPAR